MPDPATLRQVAAGSDLSMDQMAATIDSIMRGEWQGDQIARLLVALHDKGETIDEVAGAAAALRRHMTPIRHRHPVLLDTCGTGGGGSAMFNVSTTAAVVAAAAGVPVAKHGNRSITSRSGSADVLAELGVNIQADVAQVEACLDELGLCFCFAPLAHPSMKHVAAVRRSLGIRTIFNVLGPLANPARATHQLLGAGRPELRPLLAGAMARLGTERTLVVAGDDGLGDVTISGTTHVSEVITPSDVGGTRSIVGGVTDADSGSIPKGVGSGESATESPPTIAGGTVREFTWQPEDFGLERASLDTLAVDGPAASAELIRGILAGQPGAPRDIVVLNAAAGLITAGKTDTPQEAATQAAAAIDSGVARELLARLAARSHASA